MRVIRYSIVIGKAVDVVFDYATSLKHISEWQSGVVSARLVAGGSEMQAGTRAVEVRRLMGREMEAEWEVTQYERPSIRGFKTLNGPLQMQGYFHFEPVEEGTQFTFYGELTTHGILRVFEPLLVRLIHLQNTADFARLKTILESS